MGMYYDPLPSSNDKIKTLVTKVKNHVRNVVGKNRNKSDIVQHSSKRRHSSQSAREVRRSKKKKYGGKT